MLSNNTACVIVRKLGLVYSELESAMDLHGLPTGREITWGGEDALLYTGVDKDIAQELEPYHDLGYDALYVDNQGSVWAYDYFGQQHPMLKRIAMMQESQLPPGKPDDVLHNGKHRFVLRRLP